MTTIATRLENAEATPLVNSPGTSKSRLLIKDLDAKTHLIAMREMPTTTLGKVVLFFTGHWWQEFTYTEETTKKTHTVLINKSSFFKRISLSLEDPQKNGRMLIEKTLEIQLKMNYLSHQDEEDKTNFLKHFESKDLSEKQKLQIFGYCKIYQSGLIEEARKENKNIRITPSESGLARTLLITPKGQVFIILNRTKKQDKIVGRGSFKTVKFCYELTEGKLATHTTFTSKHYIDKAKTEVMFLEKFNGEPNILQVLATDEFTSHKTGQAKYAMITEYCEEGDLLDKMSKETIPSEDLPELFKSLITALQKIHKQGIIHRDLKPENIFLKKVDGKLIPVIADFGVSYDKTDADQRGKKLGTVLYLHPIIAKAIVNSKKIDLTEFNDESIDIWSLGCIFYMALYNENLPWISGCTLTNLSKITRGGIEEIRDHSNLKYLIWKMLQVDPKNQFSLKEALSYITRFV